MTKQCKYCGKEIMWWNEQRMFIDIGTTDKHVCPQYQKVAEVATTTGAVADDDSRQIALDYRQQIAALVETLKSLGLTTGENTSAVKMLTTRIEKLEEAINARY
jgi:hypothetical protein